MAEKKYITVNGVMKKNPNYVEPGKTLPAPVATPVSQSNAPLAVVSSVEDIATASTIQEQYTGITVPVADTTSETIDMMKDNEMLALFKSRLPVDGREVIDELGKIFARYETPLGMINKLMMLTEYKLDFIIDDSTSMNSPTDVDALDATEPVKTLIRTQLRRDPRPGEKMSRLQEAEDRLHILIDILAYIPVEHIQVRFLNSKEPLVLDRTGKTPEEFKIAAHKDIRDRFAKLRLSGTPVFEALKTGFAYTGKWSHYLFNDGEPNEGGDTIARQIISREIPEDHPLTLISCTNNDKETAWMKLVDAQATYVAEVDDFGDEKDEVLKNQGSALPYTRGLWILSQLVASINPFDLDKLDENLPLTKSTLDNILGRKLNPNEYQYYFERNPNASLYVNEYARFLNEEVFANQIIPSQVQAQRERAADYVKGERPKDRQLANIAPQLAATTAAANQQFAVLHSAERVTSAQSAASIAPNAAFMPAPKPSTSTTTAAKPMNTFTGFNIF